MAQHSKAYRAVADKIDKDNLYTPLQATTLAKESGSKKYDSTVDVSIRLGVDPRKADQMVRGTVNLPHGTGKTSRVLVFATGANADAAREAGADHVGADELVDKGVTRALFPHGLGHSLGVTVHDVGMKPRPPRPENKFLRNTSVIEIGQVFTIEPGVYIIDPLIKPLQAEAATRGLVDWAMIDELRPFGGIRIEDNVVVEAHGTRNLTREAFAGVP